MKARLSFPGGHHNNDNMADSTVKEREARNSDGKESEEGPKNFKELKKLGLRKLRELCVHFNLEKDGTKAVLQSRGKQWKTRKLFLNFKFA